MDVFENFLMMVMQLLGAKQNKNPFINNFSTFLSTKNMYMTVAQQEVQWRRKEVQEASIM